MKSQSYYDDKDKLYLSTKIILIILIIYTNKNFNNRKNPIIIEGQKEDIIEKISRLIKMLNKFEYKRTPKYILFFDFITSSICLDKNSYILFQEYQKKNDKNAFYVINKKSKLYNSLLQENNTQNLIPFTNYNYIEDLFPYLLNSKIIIQSYALYEFQVIINNVSYLKLLYLCHAVNYFKKNQIKAELLKLDEEKKNIILTSPYEYNLYIKMNLYNNKSMHFAGLPRYDLFSKKQKYNNNEKCILISFTYRSYNNSIYVNSLLRRNLESLFKDESLLSFLEEKNINLIYIPHHFDEIRKRIFKKNEFPKIIMEKQESLSYYIERCSLFITDFSSISFDFMFQKKPVLFYFIDANEKIDFQEKSYMTIDGNNSIYFENVFYGKNPLINSIKYYINRNFRLNSGLSKKYKSMFYYKKDIINKVIKIINELTQ